MLQIFQQITNFFNHPVFIIAGGITITIAILGVIYKIICMIIGVTPIVFRLGVAIWKRKIAIFSSVEGFEVLKESILDSGIFKEKNIVHIKNCNLDRSKGESIFLVDWETCGDEIEKIFSCRKNHQTSVIIYAKPGSIPHDKMNDIANRSNTVVVNFRGRLLNDILTSLLTTAYE
jgi:hypothetical protein